MLTCHQRTRKHFSQLLLRETCHISALVSKAVKCPQKPGRAKAEKGRVRLFPGLGTRLTEQNRDRGPAGRGTQVIFHLLPKLHDGRGGILQGHMTVVAHVQFLELHTILYSGNKTRNRRLTSARAGPWETFRADGATRGF